MKDLSLVHYTNIFVVTPLIAINLIINFNRVISTNIKSVPDMTEYGAVCSYTSVCVISHTRLF